MDHLNVVENLYTHFSSGKHRKKCFEARKNFFKLLYGEFRKIDSFFEEMSNHFIFWFLFERDENKKLIKNIMKGKTDFKVTEDFKKAYKSFLTLERRVFSFVKKKKADQTFVIFCPFEKKKLEVLCPIDLSFCSKKTIFDAYIVWDEQVGQHRLIHINLFHPESASEFLLKKIKAVVKEVKNVSLAEKQIAFSKVYEQLSKMYYNHIKYQNLGIHLTYCQDSVLLKKIEAQKKAA